MSNTTLAIKMALLKAYCCVRSLSICYNRSASGNYSTVYGKDSVPQSEHS